MGKIKTLLKPHNQTETHREKPSSIRKRVFSLTTSMSLKFYILICGMYPDS